MVGLRIDAARGALLVGHAQALFDNASSSMHAEIDSLRTALATMHNEIAGRRTEVDQQAQKLLAAGDGFSQRMSQTTGHLSRSEEHTSELQSLMRISYAVFCLKKKKKTIHSNT